MAVGYRNNAGFDFDALFQPGSVQAPGFRKADGTDLRYAARGATPKIPDVGYRDEFGVDLSNLWMALQTAPPMPGFDGGVYRVSAVATPSSTGDTSAHIRLTMDPAGTWQVVSQRINAASSGTVVMASGVWLPAGSSAGDFTVRYAVDAGTGQGITSNDAASAVSLSVARTFSMYVEVPAASSQSRADERLLAVTLTRVGSGSTIARCLIGTSAAGYV